MAVVLADRNFVFLYIFTGYKNQFYVKQRRPFYIVAPFNFCANLINYELFENFLLFADYRGDPKKKMCYGEREKNCSHG